VQPAPCHNANHCPSTLPAPHPLTPSCGVLPCCVLGARPRLDATPSCSFTSCILHPLHLLFLHLLACCLTLCAVLMSVPCGCRKASRGNRTVKQKKRKAGKQEKVGVFQGGWAAAAAAAAVLPCVSLAR
jgi:hypothetical protein